LSPSPIDASTLPVFSVGGNTPEGPKAIPVTLNFTASVTSFTITGNTLLGKGTFSALKSCFIDNSQNQFPLTLQLNSSVTMYAPALSQGFYKLPSKAPFNITISTNGAATVQLLLLNESVQPAVWAPQVTAVSILGQPVNVNQPHGSASYTAAGEYTFIVPFGVSVLNILGVAPGGGGAGGQDGGGGGGGGGGGSGYLPSQAVSQYEQIYISLGAAGSGGAQVVDGNAGGNLLMLLLGVTILSAAGGAGGASNGAGGAGGAGSSFAGGAGAAAAGANGGGGGSSAGASAAGNNGNGVNGGAAVSGGGPGGNAGSPGAAPLYGPGGGGGGGSGLIAGAAGNPGEVLISW
jgi:hypothetical protein